MLQRLWYAFGRWLRAQLIQDEEFDAELVCGVRADAAPPVRVPRAA